jgi:hypothetical protein
MNDDITFAGWQCFYLNENGKQVALGLVLRGRDIVLVTSTGERLRFTPLEAGLLLDGIAAAIRAVGSVP